MKYLRYTTPTGPIWTAGGLAAKSKEGIRIKLEANATTHATELPAPYKPLSGKSPMLVVGANNWIRQRIPFHVLQAYDLHLFFMPCHADEQIWKVGIIMFDRSVDDAKPLIVSTAHKNIETAIDESIMATMIESEKTTAPEGDSEWQPFGEKAKVNPKMNVWLTHWVYRCPKISLKDVLSLEPYKS